MYSLYYVIVLYNDTALVVAKLNMNLTDSKYNAMGVISWQ